MSNLHTPADLQDLKKLIQLNDQRAKQLVTLFRSAYQMSISNVSEGEPNDMVDLVVQFEPNTKDWTALRMAVQGIAEDLLAENLLLKQELGKRERNAATP